MKKIITFLFTLLVSSQLISGNINWSFPPTTISNASLNSSDPQIATDANGNVTAAWLENGFIKASSKPLNMNWGVTTTLSNTGASSPRLVSDASGNATAIWLEGGIVKASSKPSAGNWSAATNLSLSGAAAPHLGINSTGDVVAVWTRSGDVEAIIKLSGGNWLTRTTINSTGAAAPYVALGGTGTNRRAVIVWHGVSGSTNVVYSSTRIITSGSWANQLAISDATHNAVYPSVALDANANATAVWYKYDLAGSLYEDVVVQSSSRSATTNVWETPVNISSSGVRNPATLIARIAYDANGNAVAFWNTSYDDMTYNIESALRPVRENWTQPVTVVSANLYSSQLDLTTASFGDALALYMFYNGASLIIQSAESNISGFLENLWSVPINVSSGSHNSTPRTAATVTGDAINAAVVWMSSNGSHTTINAVTGARSLPLPPSGLMVVQSSQNFGVFTEYRNTISWTASSDPHAAGYLIYRNGTLIAQLDADTLEFIDENRVQNGAVVYGVATIDNQQLQSRIININYP